MAKLYRVTLEASEREELGRLLSRGKADVRRLKHARVLLQADEADDREAWTDGADRRSGRVRRRSSW